jgi:hypothetical protein
MVVVCGLLCLAGRAFAQDQVTVSVWPDKLLYDPGQTANLDVTVVNPGKQPVQGRLTVKVLWEMAEAQTVLDQPFLVGPEQQQRVRALWKTLDVLGCEARADLFVGDQRLAGGSEYFNVCPTREMQRVGIYAGGGSSGNFFSTSPANLDALTADVLRGRSCYGNFYEYFGWPPDTYANLAPAGDEWPSVYGWVQKAAVRHAIAQAHRQGLKVMCYAAGYAYSLTAGELARRHPDWFMYGDDGEIALGPDIPKMDWQRNPDHRATSVMAGWAVSAFPNFTRRETVDFGLQQIIASTRMFGWDGVRFDGHYLLYPPGSYDVTGKRIPSGEAAAAVERLNTRTVRSTITKLFPNYLFMYNSGTDAADLDEECRGGGGVGYEPIRGAWLSTAPTHSWQGMADFLNREADRARARGGYTYPLMPCVWDVCPNVDRIQYPIVFACGNHPWFAGPTLDRASDRGGSHYPIQKDLFRFATRFSAVLWGRGIQRVPAPESLVAVTSPGDRAWWKDFVYQRPLAGGKRQVVVHLINRPDQPNLDANNQQLPAPLTDVVVKFQRPPLRVWLATSDPALTYQQVPVENGVVRVPELKLWTIVVAEMEGE